MDFAAMLGMGGGKTNPARPGERYLNYQQGYYPSFLDGITHMIPGPAGALLGLAARGAGINEQGSSWLGIESNRKVPTAGYYSPQMAAAGVRQNPGAMAAFGQPSPYAPGMTPGMNPAMASGAGFGAAPPGMGGLLAARPGGGLLNAVGRGAPGGGGGGSGSFGGGMAMGGGMGPGRDRSGGMRGSRR